ncbi:centrosomal protein of 152 kDa [Topomyia yanbarensis]|uniref:centrosomal protein of 152 kDa n=1 Tax=Topomyia yanbarensis TaxID=2498891 RepID=UPI00273CB4E5|nr:centrosomal protein of 152 kDa [Topomyia yanbarensis]
MNGNPGTTLFNDGGSIQVNNASALQRAEEEEALEDQQRRNAELAKEMENAFDDLIDDDDQNDTLNSLNYLSNYSEQLAESPPPPPLPMVGVDAPKQKFLEEVGVKNGPHAGGGDGRYNPEVSHWKKMFEFKCREFEHVTRLLHDKSKEFEQEKGELRKRLMLAEGERDRANMTRTQTHDLLVASKTKVSEQEDAINKLKTKIKTLEEKNLELEAELENKKTVLQDTLHKYRMVEQNVGLKADRHTDQLLKQAEEKHNAKVTMMQQQIDNLRSDLDDRVQEVRRLEVRYKELQSLRDTLLVEKSETIQRLQDKLEESQRQCENLMGKTMNLTGFTHDNLRLKTKVNALEQQTQDMQRTINTLTQRLESSNAELELMDSLVCAKDETGELAGESGCTFGATRKNLIGSTPINPNMKNTEERVTKLKHELLICMNGQKEKREAIKRLEADLAARDQEINQLKKDESSALVQMNQYKEEAFRVNSKLKILENELEKFYKKEQHSSKQVRRSSYDKQDALEDKIFTLQQEKIELEEKVSSLENENRQLEERGKKSEADSKTLDEVKLDLEKQKFLLKDAQSECERVKNLYIEMSSCKDAVCRELDALKHKDTEKELSILHEKVASLERALQLAELKSSELSKMLEKEKLEHEKLLKDLRERRESSREVKEHSQSINSCARCVENLTEMSKVEIQNLQLQNTCASHLRQINELKNALHKSRATINDLNQKLDLKAERDYLIDELKQKAAQFEEFMRNQHGNNSNSSGHSSTKDCATSPLPQHQSRDQSVGTSPELLERTEMQDRKIAREQENRIREEMARAFAAEIKIIEEKFKVQFSKFEGNITELKNELHDRVNELLIRSKEVEVLKFAIKAEREKVTEMLAKKDNDARALFDKQAEVMKKYKSELNNAQQKIHFLEGELQEKRELIQAERESMTMLTKQITEERKMFHEREIEVIEKFKEIEEEYNKSLAMVTEKYNSVKKTALNYKKYAEDKEQHMMKEYDRIKEGYNTALLKVQNRMKEVLESKDRSMKEQISKLESDYRSKLSALKENA